MPRRPTLPGEEYGRLLPHLESVPLPFMAVLYEGGKPIRHVYFPEDGLISLLIVMEDETVREIGVIGNEGMLGVAVALGDGRPRPGNEFEMKHEFLATMLGVTRSVVTRAAGRLQKEEMIRMYGGV